MKFEAKTNKKRMSEILLSSILVVAPISSCKMVSMEEFHAPRYMPKVTVNNYNPLNCVLYNDKLKSASFLRRLKKAIQDINDHHLLNKKYAENEINYMHQTSNKNSLVYAKKANIKRQG